MIWKWIVKCRRWAKLKKSATSHVFRAWLVREREQEKESLKKNGCVSDALLLEKYKGLLFLDLDIKINFTVHEDNLEFSQGGGWNMIGNSTDKSVEDEGIVIEEMIIGMNP